jgi:hypothetical protein
VGIDDEAPYLLGGMAANHSRHMWMVLHNAYLTKFQIPTEGSLCSIFGHDVDWTDDEPSLPASEHRRFSNVLHLQQCIWRPAKGSSLCLPKYLGLPCVLTNEVPQVHPNPTTSNTQRGEESILLCAPRIRRAEHRLTKEEHPSRISMMSEKNILGNGRTRAAV